MSLKSSLKNLFGTGKRNETRMILRAPVTGQVVPVREVKDETFALGILGDGVAILPFGNELCAPADARIEQVFDSAHAVTLVTEEGVELLMHVGIDTVELAGKHFECLVRAGNRVRAGDALLRFEGEAIVRAGYDLTTPIVVGNSEDYDITVVAGETVRAGDGLLELRRKEE